MQQDRWQTIERIFSEAAGLPPVARVDFLVKSCGEDLGLRAEISSMLAEDLNEEFLSEPIFYFGARLLDADNLPRESKFGFYELQKLLGRGGMGAVFLARDTRLERPVALKILPASLVENEADVTRFRQEARAASGVSHPNVAHIYEFGEIDNRWFIAMEYVAGKTLRESLKEESLDEAAILEIARQIADALAATHQRGFVHQDIKPENVMIAQSGAVKILDFGLAKSVMRQQSAAENEFSFQPENNPEEIFGTVAYMSPEQISGKEIDWRADLWSFGVMLFEMLTGERPFAGVTLDDWRTSILNREAALEKCPKHFRPIVSKLLQKNLADRFQSAADLLAELNRLKETLESKNRPRGFAEKIKERKSVVLIAVLTVLFGLSAAGFRIFSNDSTSLPESAPLNSIAVLPFVNENGSEDNDYLADGLTESLINKLSRLPKLSVETRSAVFRYKGKTIDPQTVGRELMVQTVLLGHIIEQNQQLILDLDLIDAQTGVHLWNKKYDYRNADIVGLQNEFTRDVTANLKFRLSGAEEKTLGKNYTENAEAYRLYLKGRFFWNKRTAKDLVSSVEYYEQAITLDANFALAFAGLADSYLLMSGYGAATPRESFPKAKAAAKKALEIDDTLAEAHNALAYALFNYDWNAVEAEKEIKLAIELNPNYATAHQWYGNAILLAGGRFEEAIAELKRAQELDPLSLSSNADLGTTLLFARRADEAIEQFRKTVEMDDNFSYAHSFLCRAYLAKNNFPAAISECQKAQSLSDDPRPLIYLARVYAKSGGKRKSLELLNKLKKTAAEKYISAYYLAIIYAGLGENDRAFEQLEKALLDREGRLTYLKVDPLMDELRADRRFENLVERVGIEVK